jgi:glyoxylase-like metal-dependent hydrolase (beta-lactamase superfamily II)
VPGHTLGNTALLLDNRHLFSGDTIFMRSVARPDLGGKAEGWAPLHADSLRRLLELPDDTRVFPGHVASPAEADEDGVFAATLGRLRGENPELRRLAADRDAFVQQQLRNPLPIPPQYVQIKRVNAGLAEADEDESFELEIGKNVCGLAPAGS